MNYIFPVLLSIFLMIGACKETNTNQNNDATKKMQTKEDSAYNEVIGIHDEVMPKMGKLIGYKKKTQYQLDSITAVMKKKNSPVLQQQKNRLDSLLVQLQVAEKGMNDWMQGFEPEPKLPTSEERVAYFQEQKRKAQKMKDDFFAALNEAKQIFKDNINK